jgi:hypothetical protein
LEERNTTAKLSRDLAIQLKSLSDILQATPFQMEQFVQTNAKIGKKKKENKRTKTKTNYETNNKNNQTIQKQTLKHKSNTNKQQANTSNKRTNKHIQRFKHSKTNQHTNTNKTKTKTVSEVKSYILKLVTPTAKTKRAPLVEASKAFLKQGLRIREDPTNTQIRNEYLSTGSKLIEIVTSIQLSWLE